MVGREGRGHSQEAIQTYNKSNMMRQFIVDGSFLQVEVLMHEGYHRDTEDVGRHQF